MQPDELALSPLQARSADSEWFEELFRDQYPRVVGLLSRITGNRAQAEEIAAEAFSKLARRVPLLSARADSTAWVYRVAINAALDAARANSRRRKSEEAAGAEQMRASAGAGALDEILRRERCEKVRAILAAMKPRDAQLLLLRSSGLAYREIAQTLGVQASSIGTLLARAEREFETKYRARYGGDV